MNDYKPGDLSSLFGIDSTAEPNVTPIDPVQLYSGIVQRQGNIDNLPVKRNKPTDPLHSQHNDNEQLKKPTSINKRSANDSDEDIAPVRKNKKLKVNHLLDERNYRTLFLGNVSLNSTKHDIKSFLSQANSNTMIESIRFRSIPISNPKLPRKVVAITHSYHPSRTSQNAYVVLDATMCQDDQNQESEFSEIISKYCSKLNGTLLNDHHIRVDTIQSQLSTKSTQSSAQRDITSTIFIGNLNINTNEEELHQHFSTCGKIINVRIIRDREHNISKGIAYIQFDRSDAVRIALALNGTKFNQRDLRISRCMTDNQLEKRKLKSANNTVTTQQPVVTVTAAQRRLARAGKLDLADIVPSSTYMGTTTSKKDIKTKLKLDSERVKRRKEKKLRKQTIKKQSKPNNQNNNKSANTLKK